MSDQLPMFGRISTPFSRNDPFSSFVGWVSALPTVDGSSHFDGDGSGQRPPQQTGTGGADFHNHFTTPAGSQPPRQVQNGEQVVSYQTYNFIISG